jgi:hypothetical protein
VQGKAVVKNRGEVSFADVFSGDTASASATSYLATPIAQLMTNDFERVDLEKIDITLTATELQRSETLERVWLDTPRPRPGQTLEVKVLSRTYRGEDVTRTVSVAIPPNAKGKLSLLVADGTRLAQMDQRETGQAKQLESLSQMIRLFNRLPEQLHLRPAAGPRGGAIVGGSRCRSVAWRSPSTKDRSGGSFVPLRPRRWYGDLNQRDHRSHADDRPEPALS